MTKTEAAFTHRIRAFVRPIESVLAVCLIVFLCASKSAAAEIPESLGKLIRQTCLDCHAGDSAEGGLDLATLAFTLDRRELRDRWILIHDRIDAGEMPPDPTQLSDSNRRQLLETLNEAITVADRADVKANGRGPLRRLTREEYEQNLRDVLQMPMLDIRDMLPEDRESHRFNKTAGALDMSRVQLAAYLVAAEAALQLAKKEVDVLTTEVTNLAAAAKTAPDEQKAEVEKAAQQAAAKKKAAEAAVAVAVKTLKAASAKAKPKDIVDIVVSTPVKIRVNPAEESAEK